MSANGQLTAAELVTVQGTMQLATSTAAAWFSMKNAAAAQGVTIQIAGPAGAYRSLAVQQAMHDNPAAWNVSNPGLLASVGDSSHGHGDRVDISPASANVWAIAHAAGFGFVRDIANDFNHYHFTGTPSSGEARKEEIMLTVVHRTTNDGHPQLNGMVCLFGPRYFVHFSSRDQANYFAANFTGSGEVKEVDADQFNLLVAAYQVPIAQVYPGNAWAA